MKHDGTGTVVSVDKSAGHTMLRRTNGYHVRHVELQRHNSVGMHSGVFQHQQASGDERAIDFPLKCAENISDHEGDAEAADQANLMPDRWSSCACVQKDTRPLREVTSCQEEGVGGHLLRR
jgi:hypothetical protein